MTRVTFLTKSDCDLCDQAKRSLARVCDEFEDVTVEIVDMAGAAGQQLAHRAGMVFPPGVLLDGRPFSYGRVSERKLRRALADLAGHK